MVLLIIIVVVVVSKVASHMIQTVAGQVGCSSLSGDGGPATAACLNLPTVIVVSSIGEMYIADQGNNIVRKVKENPHLLQIGH